MNDIVYSGPFKDHIKRFVDLKQAVGYKYLTETAHLKRFDTFTIGVYGRNSYPTDRTGLVQEAILRVSGQPECPCFDATAVLHIPCIGWCDSIHHSQRILPEHSPVYSTHLYTR